MVAVVEVKILPTKLYDEQSKVMIGAQIIVTFRNVATGPDLYALSRVAYAVPNTAYEREYHKFRFIERASKWL